MSSSRPVHELAKLLKERIADGAETVSTRVANEFGTVVDVDPLRIYVHASGLELDESELYYLGLEPEFLDVDDVVLLNVVGDDFVLVGEIGNDSFDKLAKKIASRNGSGVVPDATPTSKGIVQLAGDLAGTADAPTVPALAAKAPLSHTHPQSDVTNLVTDLAAKAPLASPAFTGTLTIDGTVNLYNSGGALKTDDDFVANKLTTTFDVFASGTNKLYVHGTGIRFRPSGGQNQLGALELTAGATGAALAFYSEAGTSDVDLFRGGANILKTNDAFQAASYSVGATPLASTHLSDSADLARIASPTFTGVPAGPTATVGTNTTQLATTAFVLANQSTFSGSHTGDITARSGGTQPAVIGNHGNFSTAASFWRSGSAQRVLGATATNTTLNAEGASGTLTLQRNGTTELTLSSTAATFLRDIAAPGATLTSSLVFGENARIRFENPTGGVANRQNIDNLDGTLRFFRENTDGTAGAVNMTISDSGFVEASRGHVNISGSGFGYYTGLVAQVAYNYGASFGAINPSTGIAFMAGNSAAATTNYPTVRIDSNGTIRWGPGSTTNVDTELYRSGVNTLATNTLELTGVLTGRSRQLGLAGANGGAGRVEVWDRLSVSNGHSFGAFVDPGAGGIFANGPVRSASGGFDARSTTASSGYIGMVPGTTGNSGYIQWYTPNGTRQGYMGFDTNNAGISLNMEIGQFGVHTTSSSNMIRVNGANLGFFGVNGRSRPGIAAATSTADIVARFNDLRQELHNLGLIVQI